MTAKNPKKKLILDILLMLGGATLTTFGVLYFFDPAGLVTGGISGLSIITRSVSARYFGFEIPLWLSNLVFNIPIFAVAMKMNGLHSVLRSGFVWIVMTLELFFFPNLHLVPDNLLLTAIYGSIFCGVGTGLLLQARATSAGTDMLGYALHEIFRSVSVGRLIQIIDGIVVLLGAVVFSIENTLFAIISVFITGKIVDYVMGRGKSARMAIIISDESEKIAKEILTDRDRGVTALRGRGMYTGAEKEILFCICSNRDVVGIKDIVKKYDNKAFFLVGNVSEAMGEGFLEIWD